MTKETQVLKSTTFEQWRVATNEMSLHLGDNEQLDPLLTDSTFIHTPIPGQVLFTGADNDGKIISFPVSPENYLDQTSGSIILISNPSIMGYDAGVTISQGSTWTGVVVSATPDKILVKNTIGDFSSALDISGGDTQISNVNIDSMVIEALPIGIVRVYINNTEIPQDVNSVNGFHVVNHTGNIFHTSIDFSDFTEGTTIYQGSSEITQSDVERNAVWYGTVLSCDNSVLRIRAHVGTFSSSSPIRVLNKSGTIEDSEHTNLVEVVSGSTLELNTPPTVLDTIKIFSMNAIQAINELQVDLGRVQNLTTSSNDIVKAINEHEADLFNVEGGEKRTLASLGTNDKSSILDAINELETAARGTNGSLVSSILSTDANDISAAINEHDAELGTITPEAMLTTASTVSTAIAEHDTDIGDMVLSGLSAVDLSDAARELRTELGDVTTLDNNTGYTSIDASGGIIELQNDIGDVTSGNMATIASTVVTAIEELHGDIGAIEDVNDYFINDTNLVDALNELQTEVGDNTYYTSGPADEANSTDLSMAIRAIDTEIGNAPLTTSSQTHTEALNEHDAELGTITSAAMGTTASTVETAIAEHEGDIGSMALDTSAVDITAAINEHEGDIGSMVLDTSAVDITAAINEHEGDIGDMVFTDLSSTNISAALRELEAEKVHLNSVGLQSITSPLSLKGNITYKENSGNDSFVFEGGTTVDLSALGENALRLPENSATDARLDYEFLTLNGDVETPMGLLIDRSHVSVIPDKSSASLVWNENHAESNPARGWQTVGLDNSNNSSTADILTFYNANELIANNTESGINVTWDAVNQNFDFNVDDPTITLGTGPISGNVTITNLGDATFDTTLDANSVELTTHTTGNYVAAITGTTGQISLSGMQGEGATLAIGLPDIVAIQRLGILSDENSTSQATGALIVNGGVGINEDLYVGGNLHVLGDSVELNTETLTVEDTLILAGNNLVSEPVAGGFGLEVGPLTSPGGVASNVTGAHSIVYNYGLDRWEADGSLILSVASLGAPTVNGIEFGQDKQLLFLDGDGTSLTVAESGTDINVTYNNDDKGSDQNIFKTIVVDGQNSIVANNNDDSLTVVGTNAISIRTSSNNLIVDHDEHWLGDANHGTPGTQDGKYIKSISVNAQGHITAITSDDFDTRYIPSDLKAWIKVLDDGVEVPNTIDSHLVLGDTLDFVSGTGVDVTLTYDNPTSYMTVNIAHANTTTQGSVHNTARKYIQDITLDSMGHITGIISGEETVVDTVDMGAGFKVSGDSGSDQTIVENNILTIEGGTAITTTMSVTDTVTITNDAPHQSTNLSWSAGTTGGPIVNSSTGSNSAIPSASLSASGVVTTGSQSFAGVKTFNNKPGLPADTIDSQHYTDGSIDFVHLAGNMIQLSSEAFTDNNTSLMTSAAIDDRINASKANTYVSSASFATNTGILSLSRSGDNTSSVTVDLDGRFALEHTHPYDNYTSWTIQGDSNSGNQAVSSGETIDWAGGTDLSTSWSGTTNTMMINHDDTTTSSSNSNQAPSHASTFSVVKSLTYNSRGHITDYVTSTVTLPAATVNTDVDVNTTNLKTRLGQLSSASNNIGTSNASFTMGKDLTINGDLTVKGTTVSMNTETWIVADKNITLGNVDSPSDSTAHGGGITLLGASNKTITWNNNNDSWEFNQNITSTGTVDGRDIAADGTKLDTIETSAQVNRAISNSVNSTSSSQSASSAAVKQAYDRSWPDTVYTHPTSSGNKHVPSGGSAGQRLVYESSGVAKWENTFEPVVNLGNSSGSLSCNLSVNSDPTFLTILTGNVSVAFTNPPANNIPRYYTLIVKQDASGGRTLSWPSSVKFDGGSPPPETTSANAVDIWSIFTYDGGASYHVTLATKDSR